MRTVRGGKGGMNDKGNENWICDSLIRKWVMKWHNEKLLAIAAKIREECGDFLLYHSSDPFW
jgi:hypothetical protein